jgi:hypothetical protein
MTITVRDGSEYFRGLLLLIAKDRNISDAETILMKRIGKALGLEKDFCNNAIQEVLENPFIAPEPPRFATQDLAMKFIRDGLTLAMSDDDPHESEESWLRSVAAKNGISDEWLARERNLTPLRRKDHDSLLEVDDLTVEYSRHIPRGN